MGHRTARYINFIDNLDPTKGLAGDALLPRFSTGYSDIRHLPALLVETHSLKPYAQRVTGTYVLLESALKVAGEDTAALRRAIADDSAERKSEFVTKWRTRDQPPPRMHFLGVGYKRTESAISGGPKLEWLGTPITMEIPGHPVVAAGETVLRPAAYWIPRPWNDVVDRLRAHGISVETIQEPKEMTVEMYRIHEPKISKEPFEGRVHVFGTPVWFYQRTPFYDDRAGLYPVAREMKVIFERE